MEKTKTEIIINNREYTIVGTESQDYLQRVAHFIDKKITEVSTINPTLSNEMASVLAAINIADEYFKAIEASDNLRKQIGEYLDDMARDKNEISNLKNQITSLKSKMV